MKSAHFPLLRVLGGQAWNTTAGTSPHRERGSARRPRYGGGGPAGGVLLSCLTPHSTFQRVRAGKPPFTPITWYFTRYFPRSFPRFLLGFPESPSTANTFLRDSQWSKLGILAGDRRLANLGFYQVYYQVFYQVYYQVHYLVFYQVFSQVISQVFTRFS